MEALTINPQPRHRWRVLAEVSRKPKESQLGLQAHDMDNLFWCFPELQGPKGMHSNWDVPAARTPRGSDPNSSGTFAMVLMT